MSLVKEEKIFGNRKTLHRFLRQGSVAEQRGNLSYEYFRLLRCPKSTALEPLTIMSNPKRVAGDRVVCWTNWNPVGDVTSREMGAQPEVKYKVDVFK